jgi:Hsp20/alpha crystallin family protein
MPMDAYRPGDDFFVHFDVPGVDPSTIELTVEKNVLSVSARRDWAPSNDADVVASPTGRVHGGGEPRAALLSRRARRRAPGQREQPPHRPRNEMTGIE